MSGRSLVTLGKSLFPFIVNSKVFPCEARVIQDFTFDVIIGRDFLRKYGSKIDFANGVVEFSQEKDPLPFVHANTDILSSDDCGSSFVCSLHADCSFTIPPESEIVVMGRLNSLPKDEQVCGLVFPRPNLPRRSFRACQGY